MLVKLFTKKLLADFHFRQQVFSLSLSISLCHYAQGFSVG